MEHRIRNRRKELLTKHAKGYESVKDVEKDIEDSRKEWVRVVLGNKAASNYHFGEVLTKVGREEKHKTDGRSKFLSALLKRHGQLQIVKRSVSGGAIYEGMYFG